MAAQPVTHLLYLHGFRSSPRSFKAQRMADWLAARHPAVTWWCPQLPPSPAAAARLIQKGIADWPHERMAVVGSSLGGFYATWVAETTGCRAVLLNPAVHAPRDLVRYVGEQTAWHDPESSFTFEAGYIDELKALERGPVADPGRYLAIIAQGDEVLDWREMAGRYPGAHLRVLEGGDHALSGFDEHLPEIERFLQLA